MACYKLWYSKHVLAAIRGLESTNIILRGHFNVFLIAYSLVCDDNTKVFSPCMSCVFCYAVLLVMR